MAASSSHKGPYGPPVFIIGKGLTIISSVAGVFVQPVVGSVYEYVTVIVPLNPVGSKLAVPSPLSVTPIPVHAPPASVGVPVKVIAASSIQRGP